MLKDSFHRCKYFQFKLRRLQESLDRKFSINSFLSFCPFNSKSNKRGTNFIVHARMKKQYVHFYRLSVFLSTNYCSTRFTFILFLLLEYICFSINPFCVPHVLSFVSITIVLYKSHMHFLLVVPPICQAWGLIEWCVI